MDRGRPSFSGRHYTIEGAAAPPRPEVIPPICIGASGEQIGLPLAGRHADIWNGFPRGTDDDWRRKVDVVLGAATKAGRDPDAIQICQTVEKPLPETDAQAEELLELLNHKVDLGVTYFVMDFGNPPTTEHVARFADQVMTPLKNRQVPG